MSGAGTSTQPPWHRVWSQQTAFKAGPSYGRVVPLGVALAALHLAGGVVMAWTYDAWPVPVGLGLTLAVPLLASVAGLRRTRTAQGDRAAAHRFGTT